MENPKIAKLYHHVPEEPLKRLQTFRQQYPYQSYTIHDHEWRFIDTREGEQALVVMAGGSSIAEVSYQSLSHFAQNYRVIAPDYPCIGTISELFEGLIGLLDHLGVPSFSLMGGSYGGWMAQSFVRRERERTDMVVLSAIGPPNPENSRQLAKMLWLLSLAPTGVLRALMNRSFSRLAGEGTLNPERILMMAQLKEIMFTRVDRRDILAALRRLIDQTKNFEFRPNDLANWPGQMLVLMGSEDPSTPPEKREAMAALYPQAQHVVFEGADHAVSLTHREQYYQALDTFLAN